MPQGLLISFDGLDSSGKQTQTRALAERLRQLGHPVHIFQTPDYNTPTGQDLKSLLQGKIGNWQETTWRQKLMLFAKNRAEHRDEVINALKRGDIIIYDRYIPSSLAFMAVEAAAEGATEQRDEVHNRVRQVEYEDNKMPHEDISIFLDVSPRDAITLLAKRKSVQPEDDEYTDQIEVQQKLYDEYDHLYNNHDSKNYIRIACIADGQLRPIDQIAASVWQEIIKRHPEISPK